MAKKNKLQKFEDILNYPNVVESYDPTSDILTAQPGLEVQLKGKWRTDFFKNNGPLVLELACGKGDYAVGLARKNPEKNFLGVDIKGNRIWKGASTALEENLVNVGFLRTRIENIAKHFSKDEVDEIWITFPDPFPRKSKAGKRLTSPRFLNLYRQFLKPNGLVKLKTDAQPLFEWSLEVFEEDPHCTIVDIQRDIYSRPFSHPDLEIQTFYEKQHLKDGRMISYVATKIREGI